MAPHTKFLTVPSGSGTYAVERDDDRLLLARENG